MVDGRRPRGPGSTAVGPAGQSARQAPDGPPDGPPPTASLPRRVVLDRFESHTRHCPSCSAALAGLKTWRVVARIVAGAAFLAAVVAAGGSAADGATGAELAAAAAPGVTAAGAALGLSAGLKAAEARFVYKDYEHWKS